MRGVTRCVAFLVVLCSIAGCGVKPKAATKVPTAKTPQTGAKAANGPETGASPAGKAASSPSAQASVPKTKKLDGAVSRVDVAKATIAIVPWIRKTKKWDEKHATLFRFTKSTMVEGESTATVGEIEAGAKAVKSAHLTGIGPGGVSGTPFKIKHMSQLLHRRATVYWGADGVVTKIELPYLFAGESLPAMVGSAGAAVAGSDNVKVRDLLPRDAAPGPTPEAGGSPGQPAPR